MSALLKKSLKTTTIRIITVFVQKYLSTVVKNSFAFFQLLEFECCLMFWRENSNWLVLKKVTEKEKTDHGHKIMLCCTKAELVMVRCWRRQWDRWFWYDSTRFDELIDAFRCEFDLSRADPKCPCLLTIWPWVEIMFMCLYISPDHVWFVSQYLKHPLLQKYCKTYSTLLTPHQQTAKRWNC